MKAREGRMEGKEEWHEHRHRDRNETCWWVCMHVPSCLYGVVGGGVRGGGMCVRGEWGSQANLGKGRLTHPELFTIMVQESSSDH